MELKKEKQKKRMAISQIIILLIGIISIGYSVGSEIKIVSSKVGIKKSLLKDRTPEGTIPFQTRPTIQGEIPESKTLWQGTKSIGGTIIKNAAYSVGIYQVGKIINKWFFKDNPELADSISKSLATGYLSGKTAYDLFVKEGAQWANKRGILGIGKFLRIGKFGIPGYIWFAIGTSTVMFLLSKKTEQELIVFNCYPWKPELKGTKCEECNKQKDLSCSEYQCKSLGQGCELINKGTTQEKCVWISENDIKAPTITPLEEALKSNYYYEPITTFPNKEDRGTYILYGKGSCIPAFTAFSFGIQLNEPGTCKLDITRKDSFKDMDFYFSDGLSQYNHTYSLSLPGTQALEAERIEVHNDGNYEIYVRCQDSRENTNVGNFVFKYCIQKGPDTTAPIIVATNPQNQAPVASGEDTINLIVYVNEPAQCKYSLEDKPYKDMENSMINCKKSVTENVEMLYTCETTLQGIKDNTENKFYIKCNDTAGNINPKSQPEEGFILIGTKPLVITDFGPNETVKDSTSTVKVTLTAETSDGYDSGISTCYYKEESEDSWIKFFNSESYVHSQDLYLEQGSYKYYIRCVDLGGNADEKEIEFKVETDIQAPKILRAFKEELNLKIITNEEAVCVYNDADNLKCNYDFEEGTSMIRQEKTEHYANWRKEKTYYIKCRDEYLNEPNPSECSIIIRPFDS